MWSLQRNNAAGDDKTLKTLLSNFGSFSLAKDQMDRLEEMVMKDESLEE